MLRSAASNILHLLVVVNPKCWSLSTSERKVMRKDTRWVILVDKAAFSTALTFFSVHVL